MTRHFTHIENLLHRQSFGEFLSAIAMHSVFSSITSSSSLVFLFIYLPRIPELHERSTDPALTPSFRVTGTPSNNLTKPTQLFSRLWSSPLDKLTTPDIACVSHSMKSVNTLCVPTGSIHKMAGFGGHINTEILNWELVIGTLRLKFRMHS